MTSMFTFDVPCCASLTVGAETEKEAREKAADYLASADLSVEVDLADGYVFTMYPDSESDIELLDEESLDE